MSEEVGAAPLPPIIGKGAIGDGLPRKRQENATTGIGAAAMRALSARFLAFYFRAPVKAFFRTRVDYMGYPRAINPGVRAGEKWSWKQSSPAILVSAVREHGWSFIPNQVLPPLMANALIGAILYTSYLTTLGILHEPALRASKRVDPLPPLSTTFTAGFAAGSIQSFVAAPLDALQVRFQARELMERKYRNMWHYGYAKIRSIGFRGIFAGFSLSFVRDAFGNAAFFATFEFIKGQVLYNFLSNFYGNYGKLMGFQKDMIRAERDIGGNVVIKPHYLIEPAFLALAGVAASVVQAAIQYPISRIQDIHYGRLEWIDSHPRAGDKAGIRVSGALALYANAYRKTFKQCLAFARHGGGMRRWLYQGFLWRTLTQVPSTSAGLIAFEIIRRKYGVNQDDAVRINKDGYDILLV